MMYTWGDMETHIQQKAIEGRMITSNTQNNNKCCVWTKSTCRRKDKTTIPFGIPAVIPVLSQLGWFLMLKQHLHITIKVLIIHKTSMKTYNNLFCTQQTV